MARVERTARFRADALRVIDHYASTAPAGTAERFVDSLADLVAKISRHPEAGSPRFADIVGMPGLRSANVSEFPYLVFWLEDGDRIVLIRLLLGRRDLPEHLAGAA